VQDTRHVSSHRNYWWLELYHPYCSGWFQRVALASKYQTESIHHVSLSKPPGVPSNDTSCILYMNSNWELHCGFTRDDERLQHAQCLYIQ
jgi:hypothetical protein